MWKDEDYPYFRKCVDVSHENGTYEIECKLGLWSVSSKNVVDLLNQAINYWVQYRSDGEYKDILGD